MGYMVRREDNHVDGAPRIDKNLGVTHRDDLSYKDTPWHRIHWRHCPSDRYSREGRTGVHYHEN